MSLRTWLRDCLFDDDLNDRLDVIEERAHEDRHNRIGDVQAIAQHRTEIDKIKEQLKMPIDFRLAQAQNSLKLLTDYINEIQRDQISLEQKYAHKGL